MPELDLDCAGRPKKHLDIPLSKLEEKHVLTILYVLRSGPMQKTILTDSVTNSSDTVKKRVDLLVDLGLVVEKKEVQRPFRKMVALTDKGRLIADLVTQINMLM